MAYGESYFTLYSIIVFIIVIALLAYLIAVAFYSDKVGKLQMPTSGESSFLFWVTIILIVILVILIIYTAVTWWTSASKVVPRSVTRTETTYVKPVAPVEYVEEEVEVPVVVPGETTYENRTIQVPVKSPDRTVLEKRKVKVPVQYETRTEQVPVTTYQTRSYQVPVAPVLPGAKPLGSSTVTSSGNTVATTTTSTTARRYATPIMQ